ncbi:kelch like family member 3 [Phyllostomus discolor]|uniref:Kelch like family member 3 n=1 Tax=Phyllostomus discolor TaxID=89673 RepID=A0A833YS57_9CHIR|nr:kelch like family member 3 [Phyllostomus discolor]
MLKNKQRIHRMEETFTILADNDLGCHCNVALQLITGRTGPEPKSPGFQNSMLFLLFLLPPVLYFLKKFLYFLLLILRAGDVFAASPNHNIPLFLLGLSVSQTIYSVISELLPGVEIITQSSGIQ